ncbi:hypothetical protein LCGC14_2905650, partial [marine sediment metagenome]
MPDVREVLQAATFREIDVDSVLDRKKSSWVRFDPVLGYVPDDIVIKDGEGSRSSIYTFEPSGERKLINGLDHPCRINTYGDSFTMCQQVSDGETWQEYLAAHLGEPVRNFGNGGYGVYTAYRRALRMEATDCSGEYIVLGIYDDDHIRSLDAARWIRTQWRRRNRQPAKAVPMHGLPWAHVRFDLKEGRFVEMPGVCETDDDLRALCDGDHFYETFKDDAIAKIHGYVISVSGGGPYVGEKKLVRIDEVKRTAAYASLLADGSGAKTLRGGARSGTRTKRAKGDGAKAGAPTKQAKGDGEKA